MAHSDDIAPSEDEDAQARYAAFLRKELARERATYEPQSPELVIHLDAYCADHRGKGSWAVVVAPTARGALPTEWSGRELNTTANRMRLMAAVAALEALRGEPPFRIEVRTGSLYVHDGATKWLADWKRRGWKRSNRFNDVKNADLWQRLDAAAQPHEITWRLIDCTVYEANDCRVADLAEEAFCGHQRVGALL